MDDGSLDKDAKLWGMLCHLSALVGFVGVPFGHLVGPLVVWLIKRNESPFIDEQGKEAVNFQISLTIYAFIGIILTFFIIGIFVLIAVYIGGLVLVIMASVKANNGEHYRYPMTIRFIN